MGVDSLLLDSHVIDLATEFENIEIRFFFSVVKKDKDVKVILAGDDDWLSPSPKVVFDESRELGEESTIKASR
ncbi:hypothetical protein Bca4012_063953 [Brassica carinata]|uniref:Uncharacterized protein n=1 Tax=Brassica carinata TaxID=52824 RepID=A0A8X7V7F3_BRACI|nr:hypothetical protein Bca52824_033543 [Brassica carinata]